MMDFDRSGLMALVNAGRAGGPGGSTFSVLKWNGAVAQGWVPVVSLSTVCLSRPRGGKRVLRVSVRVR